MGYVAIAAYIKQDTTIEKAVFLEAHIFPQKWSMTNDKTFLKVCP